MVPVLLGRLRQQVFWAKNKRNCHRLQINEIHLLHNNVCRLLTSVCWQEWEWEPTKAATARAPFWGTSWEFAAWTCVCDSFAIFLPPSYMHIQPAWRQALPGGSGDSMSLFFHVALPRTGQGECWSAICTSNAATAPNLNQSLQDLWFVLPNSDICILDIGWSQPFCGSDRDGWRLPSKMLHLSVCLCPVNLRPAQCQRAGTAVWCQLHSADRLLVTEMCPVWPWWVGILHSWASQHLMKSPGAWRGCANPSFAD